MLVQGSLRRCIWNRQQREIVKIGVELLEPLVPGRIARGGVKYLFAGENPRDMPIGKREPCRRLSAAASVRLWRFVVVNDMNDAAPQDDRVAADVAEVHEERLDDRFGLLILR